MNRKTYVICYMFRYADPELFQTYAVATIGTHINW